MDGRYEGDDAVSASASTSASSSASASADASTAIVTSLVGVSVSEYRAVVMAVARAQVAAVIQWATRYSLPPGRAGLLPPLRTAHAVGAEIANEIRRRRLVVPGSAAVASYSPTADRGSASIHTGLGNNEGGAEGLLTDRRPLHLRPYVAAEEFVSRPTRC